MGKYLSNITLQEGLEKYLNALKYKINKEFEYVDVEE